MPQQRWRPPGALILSKEAWLQKCCGEAEGGENGREVVRSRMPLASLRFWLGVGVSEARMPQGSSTGIG